MDLDRRSLLIAAALGATVGGPARAEDTPGKKVLRYAFETAETSLDPVKITDLYSRTLTPHIFEGLYTYDHLARPAKIRPLTADGMPLHSDDFRVWTVKIKPGIYFAADPAFQGKRRELVAEDYVYVFKRIADPANMSQLWSMLETDGYRGLNEARKTAIDARKPFDYDNRIEGVQSLDRYTIRFWLAESRPRFIETLCSSDLLGAVAREVVEHYGDKIDAHPVGTGPFRLVEWRRSSFIAFERNPDFREMHYDAQPTADDLEGQAILARLKGRRLPMVDRVEISIVEEEQPRWLSFLNGQADLAYRVGYQFAPQAMPNGKVAPNLAKKGMVGHTIVEAASFFYFFNMEDPLVGGYTPEKVALRRAFGLALDVQTIINYAYSGLGMPSQGPVVPHTSVYDPKMKSESSDYDPARAKALLDLYGYRLDAAGRRLGLDGTPLTLTVSTQADQRSRKISEVLSKNLKVLGIGVESQVRQWPENLKAMQAGKLQVWALSLSAAGPDAGATYSLYDSTQIGGEDYARFKNPEMDALVRQLQLLPDGPQRLAAFRKAQEIALAYVPYKFAVIRLSIDMTQAQLIGYRRTIFWNDWWQFVDIDHAAVPA